RLGRLREFSAANQRKCDASKAPLTNFSSLDRRGSLMVSDVWQRVQIIGIGDDGVEGLSPEAIRLLSEADLLIGPRSTLDLVPQSTAELWTLTGDLVELVERLKSAANRRVVVLALGDPLFFGTAQY